jgi:hypothetical protein
VVFRKEKTCFESQSSLDYRYEFLVGFFGKLLVNFETLNSTFLVGSILRGSAIENLTDSAFYERWLSSPQTAGVKPVARRLKERINKLLTMSDLLLSALQFNNNLPARQTEVSDA